MDIKNIRIDYNQEKLSRKELLKNPVDFFKKWLNDASLLNIKDFNSFVISTVSDKNIPSSRVVLLREIKDDSFIFFTNYNSNKGRDIKLNNYVSMNFFWRQMERQIRIQGKIKKIKEIESDKYFKSRPYKSQIAAISSNQSEIIKDRKVLEDKFELNLKKYKNNAQRPKNWGGYYIDPIKFEFWQGRKSRMHDRFLYTLKKDKWVISRLSP
tara:strand:- start:1172 stop:1804 length:633 start_codon:yes stop_codon:yes gene_type:complete